MIKICNRIIEYSFYALFLLTPLLFAGNTSELFEFNKMWFVYAVTLIITTSWLIKMVIQRRILFCRTPLDIPILLFLSSQILSTLFSLDPHISIWGYYSRFNGGLLSILSYIFLYYAFASNLNLKNSEGQDPEQMVKRILKISLISGLIVALWGLPSHFGYDPTCLLFRGNLDVSCWTDAFQPKVRIFSTLGQPNWLAAYLSILIPISIAFFFQKTQIITLKTSKSESSEHLKIRNSDNLMLRVFRVFRKSLFYLMLTTLFFIDLLYTSSRSGFLGLTIGLFVFFVGTILTKKFIFIPFAAIAIISLIIGTPITPKITDYLKTSQENTQSKSVSSKPQGPALETGGTESGTIRKIVWQGAIDIWKDSPLFGSGVETFAFAYYKFRPVAHNMVSEWDYLYNKAHNEYLNYLATTGLFGLGSYMAIIGLFLFLVTKNLKNQKSKIKTTTQNSKPQNEQFLVLNYGFDICTLIFALLGAYLSILVSNFFGFSVVIVNLYFFMIPAFVFVLSNMIKLNNKTIKQLNNSSLKLSAFQWVSIASLLLITSYLMFNLIRFWIADTNYALGYNLDRAGASQQAYSKLKSAVNQRGDEPVFKDELSVNAAILAIESINRKDAVSAGDFVKEAIKNSNSVVSDYPNNLVFWKTRTRLFYTLSQTDPQYLSYALQALIKARELAPTDAKIAYSLGVVYGQTGNLSEGTKMLEQAVKLKPDYKDAYYALGLFYHEGAIDKKGKVVKTNLQEKAVRTMTFILDKFATDDAKVLDSLKTWKEL